MRPAGDNSFEALAVPHLEAIYGFARRLARNEHEAEDLLQETYLKACKAFGTFDLREFGIKPWLLKILHNSFLNRQAREGHAPRAVGNEELDAGIGELSPVGADGQAEVDFEYVDEEVKRALDQLQPEFRAVLLLWATMELSYQEIAEILGVPIGTVMSRLHRARSLLSRSLSSYAVKNRWIAGGIRNSDHA
ncbi:MAG: sigma-70 family RNA polymerase sigma factor [Phycisphaerae bacterium]